MSNPARSTEGGRRDRARIAAEHNLDSARLALEDGRVGMALDLAEKAHAAYSWLGDETGVAMSVLPGAVALGKRGLWTFALEMIARARRVAEEQDSVELLARCALARAVTELRFDTTERCLRTLSGALGYAEISMDQGLIGSVRYYQAWVLRMQYRGHCLPRAMESRCSPGGAQCQAKLGQAQRMASRAREHWTRKPDQARLARADLLLAHLAMDLGQVDRARTHCELAEKFLPAEDYPATLADLMMVHARVAGPQSSDEIDLLKQAARIAEAHLARETAISAFNELSRAYERRGDPTSALHYARRELEQRQLWDAEQGTDLLRLRSSALMPTGSGGEAHPTTAPADGPGLDVERDDIRTAVALRAGLTQRNVDILRLLANGGSTQTVAVDLSLAPKTVQNHLQRVYDVLGVRNRSGAILWWLSLPETRTS